LINRKKFGILELLRSLIKPAPDRLRSQGSGAGSVRNRLWIWVLGRRCINRGEEDES